MVFKHMRIPNFIAASFAVLMPAQSVIGAEALKLRMQPLSVTITDVEVARGGQLHALVFLKDGFPIKHEKALKSYFKPVDGERMTLSIDVPAEVSFALKVHHDEDGNNKVTKNWTGVFPVEGFAFSSGAKMQLMPPSFASARMSLPGDKAVSIPMIYP